MKLLRPFALLGAACLGLHAVTSAELPAWIEMDSQALHPRVVELRRDIHQHPELSNAEERTARVVAERLQALGLEVRTGIAKHGIVALLRGDKPGPCVAVRADMDALPIEETREAPFQSQHPGVMHACGHDGHTAIGVGVAELLAKHRAKLAGTVKFLFQPAEEGMPLSFAEEWGAKLMLREGALENPAPTAIFALHCQPFSMVTTAAGERQEAPLLAGQLGYGVGAISANSDGFSIVVHGKMAHGSTPHRGVDAIQVAAAIVTELQAIRSRHIDGQEPLVLTVGTIRGGDRANILAERVEMTGTVRTASTRVQERVMVLLDQIAKGVAASHGATAEVAYRKGYPAVINDAALVRRMLPTLQRLVGAANVIPSHASMGGEDFAYFAQKVPGFYFRLGVTRPGVEKPAGLHTPDFEMDESALLTGVRAMAALVLEALSTPPQ